jgi:hypothetical protein
MYTLHTPAHPAGALWQLTNPVRLWLSVQHTSPVTRPCPQPPCHNRPHTQASVASRVSSSTSRPPALAQPQPAAHVTHTSRQLQPPLSQLPNTQAHKHTTSTPMQQPHTTHTQATHTTPLSLFYMPMSHPQPHTPRECTHDPYTLSHPEHRSRCRSDSPGTKAELTLLLPALTLLLPRRPSAAVRVVPLRPSPIAGSTPRRAPSSSGSSTGSSGSSSSGGSSSSATRARRAR